MTYKELYDLIPRVFWNAVDGYWDNQETMDRKQWERIRWQTCCLINVQLPRNKQLSQQKLIRFHWELEEDSNKIDTYDKVKKQYDKFQSIKELNKKE